ncbi:hypothetical protein Ga0100231_008425 [Opitutaceae bacterium TAV4]|nr:hypothetical protein Ga0100231_008425 [Opitutaceae bacterium TAV4]RRJ98470.1 hypothetical protein Ga0100230_008705 [Opitutaceae bacterium TAV3]
MPSNQRFRCCTATLLCCATLFIAVRNLNASDKTSDAALPPMNKTPSNGLFALTNIGPNVPTPDGKRVNLFDYPVSGVVHYMTWGGVERTPGEMSWPYLERMMADAVRTNKKFAYGLLCGHHAPEWVFEKAGIEAIKVPRGNGRFSTFYLPWKTQDGKKILNTDMLAIWKKTVTAFSARLHSLPHRDRLYYVPITGIPFEANGLEIHQRMRDTPDILKWDGEMDRFWIEYCKRVIDIYIEAFPDIPLGLAFTDSFGKKRSYWEAQEIVDYAIAQAKKKNATLVPMGLWLGWDGIINGGESHPLIKQMRHFQKQGAPAIAFEGGAMGSYKHANCLHPSKQLEFALTLPAAWVQLWYFDIVYPDYRATLETWLPRLEAGK